MITGISFLGMFIFATPALAQQQCYDWTGEPPALVTYLECVLPRVWGIVQTIFVTIAVILAMYLIFKTVTSRDNPDELAQLPSKWMYLIVLVLLAVGAGGTFLNIMLRFLGFGDFDTWLQIINDTLEGWRQD